MTNDEMREIAREYESQWVTDESAADVDELDFTFEKYDLTNLKRDLRRFLESEYELWVAQFGEADADERLIYFAEEYPFDESEQKSNPLVIIEKDGKGYVWDGTHRASGLLENNIFDAWAIVGRPKSTTVGSTIKYKDWSTLKRGDEKLLNEIESLVENSYIELFDQNYEFIALDGDKPVGLITCESGGGELSVIVDPGYHGQGIGENLVKKLIGKAKKKGYEFLLAVPVSTPSRNLFKKLGFEPRGGDFILTEEKLKEYTVADISAASTENRMDKLEELEIKQQEVNYLYQLADLAEKLGFSGITVEDLKEMRISLQNLGLLSEDDKTSEAQLVDEFITAMLSSGEPEKKKKKK